MGWTFLNLWIDVAGFGWVGLFALEEVEALNKDCSKHFLENIGQSLRVKLTAHDFLLPHAHLVIHQAVLLQAVAILHQSLGHSLQELLPEEVSRRWRRLSGIEHQLRIVFLALENRKPAQIEFAP